LTKELLTVSDDDISTSVSFKQLLRKQNYKLCFRSDSFYRCNQNKAIEDSRLCPRIHSRSRK